MSVSAGPDLVSDSLIAHLDAGVTTSLTSFSPNLYALPENYSGAVSFVGPGTTNLWYTFQASVRSNAGIAPNGTTTASLLVDSVDGSSSTHSIRQQYNHSVGETVTISIFAKADTFSNISLIMSTPNFADGIERGVNFNLLTGQTSYTSASTPGFAMTAAGNGWWRCSMTYTSTLAALNGVQIRTNNGSSSFYTGNGRGSVFIWGAKLEQSGSPTTYYPVSAGGEPTTTWGDLSGNNAVGTMVNNFAYNNFTYSAPTLSLNNNSITSTGAVTLATQNLNQLALTQNFSVMFAAKKNYYGIGGSLNGNSQIFQGATNGYTSGWRISENNQGTQGAVFSGTHSWSLGYNDINTSLSVNDIAANRMCIVGFSVSPTTILGFCNGNTASRSNPLTYVSGLSAPQISFTGAGAGSWNGLVGFFMIYKRALSLGEMRQNFNALRGRYGI